MADLEAKIAQLAYDLERIKNAIGLPDDDWKSVPKGLKAMGIDKSPDWLRSILKRANYAAAVNLPCSLEKGQHFTLLHDGWLVNVATIKPILLSGQMELPDLPADYAA